MIKTTSFIIIEWPLFQLSRLARILPLYAHQLLMLARVFFCRSEERCHKNTAQHICCSYPPYMNCSRLLRSENFSLPVQIQHNYHKLSFLVVCICFSLMVRICHRRLIAAPWPQSVRSNGFMRCHWDYTVATLHTMLLTRSHERPNCYA